MSRLRGSCGDPSPRRARQPEREQLRYWSIQESLRRTLIRFSLRVRKWPKRIVIYERRLMSWAVAFSISVPGFAFAVDDQALAVTGQVPMRPAYTATGLEEALKAQQDEREEVEFRGKLMDAVQNSQVPGEAALRPISPRENLRLEPREE